MLTTRLQKINQLTAEVGRLRRLLHVSGNHRGLSVIERELIVLAIELKVAEYDQVYRNKH